MKRFFYSILIWFLDSEEVRNWILETVRKLTDQLEAHVEKRLEEVRNETSRKLDSLQEAEGDF